ncbi:type IV secretion system protein [Bartonella vinsonii]|uniref:TrwJ protein n=1 Tax=Bartonella vinsonii subsp. berkhoffii str. Tweed TaxID=1094502 RepID=N6US97_BARVB|nr:type IV secretion system protein [Bartonella vinsonii]ENN93033.1 TrwJ protein [Bartonella vinsonii subsp. berkhoffii str. Tweed]
MKRVITLATIAVILLTTNLAKALVFGAGAADLRSSVPSLPNWFLWKSPSKKAAPKKPTPPQHYVELIELIKKQLEINKQQLKKTAETHDSVTGNRKLGTNQLEVIKTDHTSFFLKDPQWIYNENSDISASKFKSFSGILGEEKIPGSIDQARKSIERRKQYAAIVDKAVSLQTFQESENRFKQISELIKQINTTTDLKAIAELQARIKGMLAMIQNESTKLQMVAHSRNAEQALISQQKQKRNMQILDSTNKGMPTIRFTR